MRATEGIPRPASMVWITGLAALAILACLVACGQNEQLPERASKSAALETIPPDQLEQIVTLFNRGVALMDRFEPVKAAAVFGELVELAPEWTTGRLNYGIALLNTQDDRDYVKAEAELKRVISEDPDDPYAYFALGMLLRHLTRFPESQALFERVLEIDPEDADAHYQLATLIVDTDKAAARTHLEKTLERIPHHESACYRLLGILREGGEKEAAGELLQRFRALKASGAGLAAGMKYSEMGRYANVIRAFDPPVPHADGVTAPVFENVAEAMGLAISVGGAAALPGAGDMESPATLGPGVAVSDVDGDGDLDVYSPGFGDAGALLIAESARYAEAGDAGLDGTDAIGSFFGDFDGDGDHDLFLTCAGPNRLYLNHGDGSFVDITEAAGVAGEKVISVGAAWADADHDGDLDLFVANLCPVGSPSSAGAPNALWRNNGDGTFSDLAGEAGVDGGATSTMGAVFIDMDGDLDLDLYVIHHGAPNRVYINQRVGIYTHDPTRFPELADDGAGLGALVGDVDLNGREDLLLLRGSESPRLFLQIDRGQFAEDNAFAARMAGAGAVSGSLGDLDLDGDLDLVLFDAGGKERFGHRILMNRSGAFEVPVPLGEERTASHARGAVTADFDGDGGLDILVMHAGGTAEFWKAPRSQAAHWLEVVPSLAEDGLTHGSDPASLGLLVEVKSGLRLQILSLRSGSGYLGSPPPRAHFGLGEAPKADYVRLSWSDAVLQSELEIAADQPWRVRKVQRKPSSCPVLFVWDGDRFEFVTDFLGVGGVGFFIAPGEYAPPDPTEDVRIPPELTELLDGRYLIRVAEPLEEVTYLDELHLRVYDHPLGTELHPDERFTGSPPFPDGDPLVMEAKLFPDAARNHRGDDVLDRVLEIDRHYVDPPRDPRFVGYADDHWLELDFGEKLQDIDPEDRLILSLYGWVEYTYSHINYAAYQAGVSMTPPSIEVPNDNGEWETAVGEMGFPAGLPRMMTYDISDLPVRENGRLRIRTNMEVFWDQVFVAIIDKDAQAVRQDLRPAVADLRFLGYPREFSPDGSNPTVYDYHRLDHGVPFKNMTGAFTRFGDVRELLASVDDRFVIMARGEELALEFETAGLRPTPPGWTRTVVLHSDGYCKDMDLYTAFPHTVEPLPFHAMENYPPSVEDYRARDHDAWHTRTMVGQ